MPRVAPVLSTAHLELRPLTREDVGRLASILSEPGVARWWGRWDEARVVRELFEDEELLVWGITKDGLLAGAIQAAQESDPDYRHAQLDIFLAESFQGQGLGPEAIRRVVAHLVDDLGHHRMVIDPAAENAAAIAAYERVGFRRVGVMRRYERRDDQFRDGLLLELVMKKPEAGSPSVLPSSADEDLLRRAGPEDAGALLPMMRDFNRFEGIQVDEARLVAALAVLLADSSLGAVWLLEHEARVVGYAVVTFGFDLEWGGRDAWLTELWVATDARGEGLGRAALDAVERQVAALGAHALHLMVRHENVRARGLYQSAGFEAPRRETLTKTLSRSS